jgi:surfeit locus 1 family protein
LQRRMIPPLILGVLGAAILIWLGVWQLHRLEWKEAVLADIEARIDATPVTLPERPDPVRDRLLPVTATGRTTGEEILVQSSSRDFGAGFRVISVFQTDGRRVLLDRGFIRAEDRDAPRPAAGMTVTGNLHWPDEVDGFTPEPDRETGLWFARDVPSMAEALGTEPALIILRDSDDADPTLHPMPVDTAGIPNDHLQYAITWFLLAIVWVAMTLYQIVTIRRRKDRKSPE